MQYDILFSTFANQLNSAKRIWSKEGVSHGIEGKVSGWWVLTRIPRRPQGGVAKGDALAGVRLRGTERTGGRIRTLRSEEIRTVFCLSLM